MTTSSLARRFQYGSNAFESIIPGAEHDFFFGVPASLRSIEASGPRIVQAMRGIGEQLAQSHGDQVFVLNEMRRQLGAVENAVRTGFADVRTSLDQIEGLLAMELSQIRFLLEQSTAHLAKLAEFMGHPRGTEAAELVEHGVRALAAGHVDDAESCLLDAVKCHRTSYHAHHNLGFVFLQQGDSSRALSHFQKASDYVDPSMMEVKIFALESLARAHFAAEQFADARRVMESALALRASAQNKSMKSEYQYAVYLALSGESERAVAEIVRVCAEAPSFVCVAVADSDLSHIRPNLLSSLETLGRVTNERAQKLGPEAESALGAIGRDVRELAPEVREFETEASKWRSRISARTLSDSKKVIEVHGAVVEACELLPVLAHARAEANAARRTWDDAVASLKRRDDGERIRSSRESVLRRLYWGVRDPMLGADEFALPWFWLVLPFAGCTKGCYDFYEFKKNNPRILMADGIFWHGLLSVCIWGVLVMVSCAVILRIALFFLRPRAFSSREQRLEDAVREAHAVVARCSQRTSQIEEGLRRCLEGSRSAPA